MSSFQVLLICAFAALLCTTALALWRGWGPRRTLLLWTLVWLIALAASVSPDLTTRLANFLGIRRGADLLLYCTSVTLLVGLFGLYARLRRIRRDLTILTRELALHTPFEQPRDQVSGGSDGRAQTSHKQPRQSDETRPTTTV